jgi:UDP:flavonoid glycosyltransferase YjiC (YdhE family)
MPHCDVYLSNGGYGGLLQGIQNEICGQVGYFKLGIDLNTETPMPEQIRNAVNKLMAGQEYAVNVKELAEEFGHYDPEFLVKKFVYMLTRSARVEKEAA